MRGIVKLLTVLFAFSAFAAFAETNILCTTLPVTALTNAVVKGVPGFKVTQMLSSTIGCPHDYALTPQDMRKLAKADVIIINGLGMEDFLHGVIPRVNRKALLIDSSKGAKGLRRTGEHDSHAATCTNPAHNHKHNDWNEHLFASPGTAAEVVGRIAADLSGRFPTEAKKFQTNAKRYSDELIKLDSEYRVLGKSIPSGKHNIAVQHGIFDYIAAAMGLHVTEYLQSHTGSEPSAAQIREMINHLKKQNVSVILAEKNYPSKVTDMISRETGIPVVILAVYPSDSSAAPEKFLAVYRDNLNLLKAFYKK